jgi:hypothetical protein
MYWQPVCTGSLYVLAACMYWQQYILAACMYCLNKTNKKEIIAGRLWEVVGEEMFVLQALILGFGFQIH